MSAFLAAAAIFLFLTVVAGFWRVLQGPDAGDRILAAQLFGTTVVAMLLLLAEATGVVALRYLALVFASLAVVVIVAFVRLPWPAESVEEGP